MENMDIFVEVYENKQNLIPVSHITWDGYYNLQENDQHLDNRGPSYLYFMKWTVVFPYSKRFLRGCKNTFLYNISKESHKNNVIFRLFAANFFSSKCGSAKGYN